ncbi:dihydrolipoamide acetyltransferase family protein [Nocardioides marmoribigeumensis]|uniref:Dihydrolipoamide acetyltransferase component of pyruvate dehydrogenase complex n=1 Tax=Nocardioides marmoribigeumensis TaxID=433649 RepID=A0ABU2BVU7_9ACTN|nr:dihydrolipoamide acetyltransferase family protein [Nocardioides marmoribigeumensis]MDR7362765.1 pyruvate dehydrogenase E2 component (dihydrolipoamide acetyltransferase) [Nocardioides marmoribigeumensis]
MTVREYKLPDPGEGLTEAEIVTWQVKVGDVIKVNDVVVEIETAKSLVELPSPYAGTVTALLVQEGVTVPVGTPIIAVDDGVASAEAPSVVEPVETIDPHNPAATGGGENQTLVGYGPRSGRAMRRARRGPATARTDAGSAAQMQVQGSFAAGGTDTSDVVPADEPPVPSTPARERTVAEPTAKPGSAWSVGGVLAKPAVRKLARDLGVDLASITPADPRGIVSADEVRSAADGSTGGGREPMPASYSGTPGQGRVATLVDKREPIKGVRKMMGQAMVSSAFSIPHVTEWITVDVTRTTKLVERLREDRDFADVKVSPLLVLARAVCLAMRRTPEVNAHWDDEAQEVVYRAGVNLGIAAATPRGLVVPNVKSADALSLVELAGEITQLTATAREGRTQPAEMAGGTFTITNVGVFGVDAGTPIINPGESAILCFGAVRKQPWVHKGTIKARDLTTLALSFDHRFIDGALGSRFLADVAALLEDPAAALRY